MVQSAGPAQGTFWACWPPLQQGSMPSLTAVQVAKAVDLWDGSGGFVFTSSAGLYTVEDGSHCNEDSPTAKIGSSDRTDRCAILQLRHIVSLLRSRPACSICPAGY